MKVNRELLPLSEPGSEASAQLRSLLRTAREDLPKAAELEHLEIVVAPLLAGGAAAAGHAAVSSATSSAAGWALPGGKVAVALAVAGGVVGAGWWMTRAARPAAPENSQAVSKRASQVTKRALPDSVNVPAASAVPAVSQASKGATLALDAPTDLTSPDDAVSRETRLLAQAQAALGSGPARALQLAYAHARLFPNGVLTQEREVIAIQALVRLGRMEEARRRAQAFELRFPGSAHQQKVQALVQGQ
ncbi:MAG TPA: hypothetical protein VGJ84_15450 [Polyangiaceae bacterium]